MIQSGTGTFKDENIKSDGKVHQIKVTVTFPKAFNNTPVVLISPTGWGYNFLEGLPKFEVKSTEVGKDNFSATVDVYTIDFGPIITPPVYTFKASTLTFNWQAYDEVTIGA